MNSSDEAVEAARHKMIGMVMAARADQGNGSLAVAVAASIVDEFAAAVRAEAVAERDEIIAVIEQYLPEALRFNTLPEIVGGIARQRDWQHELKDHLADVARRLTDDRDNARAEAVADERWALMFDDRKYGPFATKEAALTYGDTLAAADQGPTHEWNAFRLIAPVVGTS